MEGNPVYTPVVAFENVFYGCVCVAEDIALACVGLVCALEHLVFEGGECVLRRGMLFAEA